MFSKLSTRTVLNANKFNIRNSNNNRLSIIVDRKHYHQNDPSGLERIVDFVSDPVICGLSILSVPMIYFTCSRYKVSNPNEYLVRTGLMINDMKITKSGLQWPFQTADFISLEPNNYSFNLHAMSNEKMEFVLPGIFTIGPKDNIDDLEKYCKFLFNNKDDTRPNKHTEGKLSELIKGIIEGETRVLAAQMSIEELFNSRSIFKDKIVANIQNELEQFGMKVYNANIKELQDSPGSEYFLYMRQKTKSSVEGKAKIDISEAKKLADIGEKYNEIEARKKIIEYEAEVTMIENERKQQIAKYNAELGKIEAQSHKEIELAKIEATNAIDLKNAELQSQVEQQRVIQETERLRSLQLSKATADAESVSKQAEGDANRMKLLAEAKYIEQQKSADGVLALLNAQSEGLNKLVSSFNGDKQSLINYLMLEKNIYPELAKYNSEAIKGLNPKISIWNNSNNEGTYDSFKDIMNVIPNNLMAIHQHTGLKPPNWVVDGLQSDNDESNKP